MSSAEVQDRLRSALDDVVAGLDLAYPDEPRFLGGGAATGQGGATGPGAGSGGAAGQGGADSRGEGDAQGGDDGGHIVPLRRPGPGGAPDRPADRSRHRRGRLPALVATVVAVAAAAVGFALTSGGQRASASVLTEAAAHAAAAPPVAPGPGQYLYQQTRTDRRVYETNGVEHWYVDLPVTDEVWLGYDGSGRLRLTPGAPSFPSATDRAAWRAAGSPPLGQAAAFDETVASLPVLGVPGATASTTQRMTHALNDAAILAADNMIGQAVFPYPAVASLSTDPTVLEQELVDRYEAGVRDDATTFSMAASLLEEGTTPAQRSAIYTMLASLPGVVAKGTTTTDVTHQVGTAVTLEGGDPACTVIIDPSSSAVLEQRCTTLRASQHPSSATASTAPGTSATPAVVVRQTTAYGTGKVVPSLRSTGS